jgi:hypothetical protein
MTPFVARTFSKLIIPLLVLAIGCDRSPTENPSLPASGSSRSLGDILDDHRPLSSLDEHFVELAREAPGFGGLFYDEAGRLTVNLTNPSRRPEVEGSIAAFLAGGDFRALGPRLAEVARMNVRPAQYDFAQLYEWYGPLVSAIATLPGVTQTDIDDVRNRIVIGVESGNLVQGVRAQAQLIGVPAAAVLVEVIPPTRVTANLQGLVRPMHAGIQVSKTTSVDLGSCTLGYNVRRRDLSDAYDGYKYFVTAGHCTDSLGYNNGTRMGQPNMTRPIGTEVSDPPPFDQFTNSACPADLKCRYSDAALIRYDDSVSWRHGKMPKVGTGVPFTILDTLVDIVHDAVPPYPDMASVWIGQNVRMIGRSSGDVGGKILNFCVNIRVYEGVQPNGWYLMCQFQASFRAKPGDSGAPAFNRTSYGDISPVFGIVWGEQQENNDWTKLVRATFSHHYYVGRELNSTMGGGRFDIRLNQCNHHGVCPRY